ncbi:MAG: hypothetical protein J6Y02_01420 [Pseudobutyrivibrio sp.]|nr:hypothetical protein [Pseudobutyrivibrio sp.]
MAPRIMHKGVNFSGSGGGGSSTFAGLTDVNLTNLQNGQIVKYDSTSQKWVNADESGGGGTGGGNVRFNEANRYIQVYTNDMWLNAYLVPYFTMMMFDTSASISKTYTFAEEGDYLLWSSCCVYEPTSTSKVSSTAALISSNSKDGIDQDWTRTCEYYIVHAVPGDTATFTMSSYDHNSVGVLNVTGMALTELEFEFAVDNGVQLSQTYASNKDYLALMITIGASRDLSGYGHMAQSWYEEFNSVDYISNTSSTVTYNAYGYGGGSSAIIIFEAESGGGGGSTPSSNLTSTYQVIENNERQSTNVDVGFDSYTLISDPNA